VYDVDITESADGSHHLRPHGAKLRSHAFGGLSQVRTCHSTSALLRRAALGTLLSRASYWSARTLRVESGMRAPEIGTQLLKEGDSVEEEWRRRAAAENGRCPL
jgi:hypothetical protein